MGFLDNSGDIILDAILTDVGRKRMAEGKFKITRFAVGDDEIDYRLYNKNHPSGTAYYDLEIMQTPVMEAFSQALAGINYGLMSMTATDILYLPVLNVNTRTAVSSQGTVINHPIHGPNIFYVADPSTDTVTKLLLSTALQETRYFCVSNQYSGPVILFEGGLHTTDRKGDNANRTTYLVSKGLVDRNFFVYYDTRFINGIIGPTPQSVFNNTNDGLGSVYLDYTLQRAASISTDLQLENYAAARIEAPPDGVVFNASYNPSDRLVSSVNGPRSVWTALNFDIKPTLDVEFSRFGTANTPLFADGNNYSYLDTPVYIQGTTTGMRTQITIRIIKYIP